MMDENGTDEDGEYGYDPHFGELLGLDEDTEPYSPPTYEPEAALFDARGNQITTWEPIGEGLEIPAPAEVTTVRLGTRLQPWGPIVYRDRFDTLTPGDTMRLPRARDLLMMTIA